VQAALGCRLHKILKKNISRSSQSNKHGNHVLKKYCNRNHLVTATTAIVRSLPQQTSRHRKAANSKEICNKQSACIKIYLNVKERRRLLHDYGIVCADNAIAAIIWRHGGIGSVT